MKTILGHIIFILFTNNLIYNLEIMASATEINDTLKTNGTTQLLSIYQNGTSNNSMLTSNKNKEQRNVTENELSSTNSAVERVTITFHNKNTVSPEGDSSLGSQGYTSVTPSDTSTYNSTSSAFSDGYQNGSNTAETEQDNTHEMKTNGSYKAFSDFTSPSGLQEYRDNKNSLENQTFNVNITGDHQQNSIAINDHSSSTTKSIDILSEITVSNFGTDETQKVVSTSSSFHTTTGESSSKYNETLSLNTSITKFSSSVPSTSFIKGTTSGPSTSVPSTSLIKNTTSESSSSVPSTSLIKDTTSELTLKDTTTILIPDDSVLGNNDTQENTGNLHEEITSTAAVTTLSSSRSESVTFDTTTTGDSSLSHDPNTTMSDDIMTDHITMQTTTGVKSSSFVSLGQESITTTSRTYEGPESITTISRTHKSQESTTTTSRTYEGPESITTTSRTYEGTRPSTSTTKHVKTDNPGLDTSNTFAGENKTDRQDITTWMTSTKYQPASTTSSHPTSSTTGGETSKALPTFELAESNMTVTPETSTTAKQPLLSQTRTFQTSIEVTKSTVTTKSTNETTRKVDGTSSILNIFLNSTKIPQSSFISSSSIINDNQSVQLFTDQKYTDTPAMNQHTSTGNTSQEVDIHPQVIDDGDDTYWPIAVAVTIGVPVIIVLGVTITVLHRKRLGRPSRLTTSSFFT